MNAPHAEVDWSQRINAYVNRGDGSVTVPREVAKWLHAWAPVPYDRRLLERERNPELWAVLSALAMSARSDPESWPTASDLGTEVAKDGVLQQESEASEVWLTTKDASAIAGVTDRAIRNWIKANRLTADKHGHTYRISHADLQAALHGA